MLCKPYITPINFQLLDKQMRPKTPSFLDLPVSIGLGGSTLYFGSSRFSDWENGDCLNRAWAKSDSFWFIKIIITINHNRFTINCTRSCWDLKCLTMSWRNREGTIHLVSVKSGSSPSIPVEVWTSPVVVAKMCVPCCLDEIRFVSFNLSGNVDIFRGCSYNTAGSAVLVNSGLTSLIVAKAWTSWNHH